MQAVLRQGILRERLADLLTDTFRAQILRVLGFRVQVMEFVSAEATARNIPRQPAASATLAAGWRVNRSLV